MKDDNIHIIEMKFQDVVKPTYKEDKKKGFVKYGVKNDYPNYLLGLYEKSPKHGAIVRGKATFIKGKGFAYKEVANTLDNEKIETLIERANNDGESLNEVLGKAALDLELFGGAYLEIHYNRVKQVSEIYHLEFMNVRPNKDESEFYYAEDWHIEDEVGNLNENSKVEPKKIAAFDKSNPSGKQVLFIKEYTPGKKTYPLPSYYQTLRYIQVDVNVSEYHLNATNNGMFTSKLINLNNGIPEEEDKKEIERKFNAKFTGTKNAGKVMISYSRTGADAPTVLDLSGTEIDKHFDLLNKTIQQELFTGHGVTSGMIFGVKTEGQLGGRNELIEATELFQNSYVNGKQELLEKHFNNILSINSIPTVYIQKTEPIGFALSQTAIDNALSDDEKRERLGLKPRKQEQAPAATPAVQPAKFSAEEDDRDFEVFARFGKKKDLFEILHSRQVMYESEFEFNKDYYASVKDITDVQKSILDLLNKDNRIQAANIAEVLDIPVRDINAILKDLQVRNLIKVNTEVTDSGESVQVRKPSASARDVINNDTPETTNVIIRYSYEGPEDSRNRPFCAKMVSLKKLFSRQDIEAISAELGYSVWHRRGGWYTQADGTRRPFCRHSWSMNTVIEKS